jgi:hypothetical protein
MTSAAYDLDLNLKHGKNQLLQNGTDMNFDVGVSACGTIGDNQARKLDTRRIYTRG